jgi:hypothetical protein
LFKLKDRTIVPVATIKLPIIKIPDKYSKNIENGDPPPAYCKQYPSFISVVLTHMLEAMMSRL